MNPAGLRLRYQLDGEASPGGVVLGDDLEHPLFRMLEALQASGSIQHAASDLGVSYRHLWGRLRQWEAQLGEPLVEWVRGQPARLTPQARLRVEQQRMARARLAPQIAVIRQALQDALRPQGAPPLPELRLVAEHDPVLLALADSARAEGAVALRLQFEAHARALSDLRSGRATLAAWARPVVPGAAPAVVPRATPWLQAACWRRVQGLMLPPGNPRSLMALRDALRGGVRFIHAEPGSAGRRLAEHLLGTRLKMAEGPTEATPAAAALAIALGQADAALGPRSTAEALGLAFVPLVEEELLLVCPADRAEDPALRALLRVLGGHAGSTWAATHAGCLPSPEAGILMPCTLETDAE